MERGRTITVMLTVLVVALLLLNVAQFMMYSDRDNGIDKEDVPQEIQDIKGDDWESLIGDTVTVEGYYVENHGVGMLIADPSLTMIRRPLEVTEFIRMDAPLEVDLSQLIKLSVKGEVKAEANVSDRVYLGAHDHEQVLISDYIYPQYVINIPFVPSLEHSGSKYALLISGGWTAQDAWPSFWNDLKLAYSTLVTKFYYDPSNIYVLYNDGEGEDDQIPVDYPATGEYVSEVLDILATAMTDDDTLFFFATDHGGWYGDGGAEPPSASTDLDEFICLWNKEGYFDDWLRDKLNAIDCSLAIIVLDLCHSGGFTWDLSRTDRIIMTACKEEQLSYDHPDVPNGDFTYNLFNALNGYWWAYADLDNDGTVTLAEAFNYAAANSISIQTPSYDDNGDGVAHFGNIPNGGLVEDEGRLGDRTL